MIFTYRRICCPERVSGSGMGQRESDWQMLWGSDGWELKGVPCTLASERGWTFNVILLYCNAPPEDLEIKKFL